MQLFYRVTSLFLRSHKQDTSTKGLFDPTTHWQTYRDKNAGKVRILKRHKMMSLFDHKDEWAGDLKEHPSVTHKLIHVAY